MCEFNIYQIFCRKHFGVYEKVGPIDTTPSRKVPEHIVKPNYVLNQSLIIPTVPDIKDLNQLRGMKRSCKLASNILAQVQKIIEVRVTEILILLHLYVFIILFYI